MFGYIPHFGDKSALSIHIEDVREANSPPLVFMLEYVEGFIINANTTSIKGTKYAFFEAKGNVPPNKTSKKDPKFELQMNNMFTGIKEGNYYRRPLNSQEDFKNNKQISSYQNCTYFEIEAGNYLTIIQFDKPRQKGESLDQHLIQPYQVRGSYARYVCSYENSR